MKRVLLAVCILLAACGPAGLNVAPTAATLPPELSIGEYPLTQAPEAESDVLHFAASVTVDPRTLHQAQRDEQWTDKGCNVGSNFGFCVTLGTDQYFATQDYTDTNNGQAIVTRNGQEVYRVSIGPASPISGLWGLWAYGTHWAVETALVNNQQSGNEVASTATGNVAVDGQSLNDQLGYQESFGLQTLNGKPFYFFKVGGKIDASYDGHDIALGYDEVPHYNCCSAASLNPRSYPNLVTFFGRKGDTWYYDEIGVFGQ